MSQAMINLLYGLKANDLEPITLSDTVNLPNGITSGLYIGTGGNLSIVTKKGTTRIITNLTGGQFHPICCARVNLTGTTARDILAVY